MRLRRHEHIVSEDLENLSGKGDQRVERKKEYIYILKAGQVKWYKKVIYFLKRLNNGNKNTFVNWSMEAVK